MKENDLIEIKKKKKQKMEIASNLQQIYIKKSFVWKVKTILLA